MTDKKPIHIIGAGLAGSEAAWQIAQQNHPVILHEMRPDKMTPAHNTGSCAELVCSNSFRSDDKERNAVGVLHEEMRVCNSLIMSAADKHAVPAGGALAVDRDGFSECVTQTLNEHPMVEIEYGEITDFPPEDWGLTIIATGPLTSEALSHQVREITGEESLAFFDAIAPIVYRDSINMDVAWEQSRYDKGSGKDYINCPMDKEQYEAFIQALIDGEKMEFRDWEKDTPYFEGCLPIEVMASRGVETLRFGPMKPVGLTDPRTGKSPHAVVQLRQDNALGSLYNIVGFQTKLKYGPQKDIFTMIPGLENAEFARLGGIHRNTFIQSPKLLDEQLRLKARPHVRMAGQVIGVEGYVESAAMGLLAGRFAAAESMGQNTIYPPETTALYSLLAHVTGRANEETFQPMNINFGLFPPIISDKKIKKMQRKEAMAERALNDIQKFA